MDWLAATWDVWLDTFLWLAGLGVVLGALGWLMPCNRGMFWYTDLRAAATDLLYWFVNPLFARLCRTALLAAGIALLFAGRPPGFALIRDLPLWAQCIAIMLLQDVMLYWLHRAFHTPRAWRFHAIHHSPALLDWLSASRNHFVNTLFTFILADVVVQLLGFSVAALLVLAPINIAYSSMVHANLNWTFGPLRYVFASPVFHRWHHTLEEEGLNKNFAPTFPFFDLVFGTFHMPSGKLPVHFGNGERAFPDDFWGQVVYPFLYEKKQRAAENAEKVGCVKRTRADAPFV
jgi:sterol desaturase/sphingolipid hydroxylase (fatty acid hydroxylase superfamily)